MTTIRPEFDDIRPYNDDEVVPVMQRLMADPELADTILGIKHPVASRHLGWLLRPLVRRALHRAFDGVRTVRDLQLLVEQGIERILVRNGTRFSVSGFEHLNPEGAHLFIGNHRDIAMDPAFVDYGLHKNGRDTVRIAIGDNLLSKPFATDLMRLNKSFIVRRSATGRREKLAALTTLSRYIRHSICEDNSSVWIAQREGRAKDGIDRTESALVKMLSLGRDKGEEFADTLGRLNIIPVSISYCLDPCDVDKARELHARRSTGSYEKQPHEDLRSMHKGIVGNKRAVHLAFGEPLADLSSADAVVRELDRQILHNYRLHPTNLIAWEKLHGHDPRVEALKAEISTHWQEDERMLMARVEGEPDPVREIFLAMYANPVQSRLDIDRFGEPVEPAD